MEEDKQALIMELLVEVDLMLESLHTVLAIVSLLPAVVAVELLVHTVTPVVSVAD